MQSKSTSVHPKKKSTLTFVNGRSAIRARICSRSRCSLCAKDPSRAPKATPGALRSSPRPSVSLTQAPSRSQVRIYRPCAVQMGLPRSCEKSDIDETSPLRSGLHLPSSPTSTKHRPCAANACPTRQCLVTSGLSSPPGLRSFLSRVSYSIA